MIIDADLSALEWRTAAELSRDKIMMQEIMNGEDAHLQNAINYFGDGKFRQEAKVLGFRMIYGGSAFAFFKDANMPVLPLPTWESIVENFYAKYSGLSKWQKENYKTVCKQGWYVSFTGRRYWFNKVKKYDGTLEYSWPSVCNYICQGTATGDVVPLVLTYLLPRVRKLSLDIKLINQVHDSIVFDSPPKYVEDVCELSLDAFEKIPELVKKQYGYDWKVPMAGECKFGKDWSDMTTYKRS